MLDKLPIEVLLEIYQYLSPEQAPDIALIDKRHALFVSNPFWERKFEVHFPYLLNELPKEENRNWYTTFKMAYDQEYANLSKLQRGWFSLVKEGKPTELEGLSIHDLLSLGDAKRISLISWAKEKQYQYVLDYFWSKIVVPFFVLPSNLKDKYGNSILHFAVLLNQKESVENLIISGEVQVDINASSRVTPLHYAAKEGHADIVELLLKNGADINARSNAGATALLFAIENNHPEVVKTLLQYNADTSIAAFKIGQDDTPLHAAINLDRKDIVKQLLSAKANVNALGASRNTPLHYAAKEGHADIVELLLKNGADINARSHAGATALLFAIENNHPEVVKTLLQYNADTSIPLGESTPYHTAFKVTQGDTPLHAAINLGQKDIVRQLLAAKANKDVLLEAAQRISSVGQGSYAQEREKKWGSFFKPRNIRADQLATLAGLDKNSSVEHIAETFITISKAIHQEYHLAGDSTLAQLIDKALNEAVASDEVCLKYFKTSN